MPSAPSAASSGEDDSSTPSISGCAKSASTRTPTAASSETRTAASRPAVPPPCCPYPRARRRVRRTRTPMRSATIHSAVTVSGTKCREAVPSSTASEESEPRPPEPRPPEPRPSEPRPPEPRPPEVKPSEPVSSPSDPPRVGRCSWPVRWKPPPTDWRSSARAIRRRSVKPMTVSSPWPYEGMARERPPEQEQREGPERGLRGPGPVAAERTAEEGADGRGGGGGRSGGRGRGVGGWRR